MNLREILDNQEDQARGADLNLLDPVDGTFSGITFRICGPDSLHAQRSRLQLMDDLAEASDATGRVAASVRESLVIDSLARLVVDLLADEEDGKRLQLSHANLVKLIRVPWIREQVDAFAGDRRNFARGKV